MPRIAINVDGEIVTAANPLPVTATAPLPTTFPHFGQKAVTTAGTREALVASSTPLSEGWVYIIPFPSNSGVIYVGDVTVTSSNGVRLGAGTVWPLRVDDLADIYIDAAVGEDGASWMAW